MFVSLLNGTESNASLSRSDVFTTAEDITLKFFFVFFSCTALIGNTAVCYIILKYKKIRNTVNLLLLNLSLADIVTALAVYPYLFFDLSQLNVKQKYADLLCGMTEGLALFFSASLVNLLMLSLLSLSRYMLINHPTKQKWRIKKKNVKWLSAVAWVIAISMLIPSSVSFRYDRKDRICWRRWAKGIVPILYFIATLIIGMAIPLFTLAFTYAATIYTLWFKPSTRRLTRSKSQTSISSSRKRISILLGFLILVYLICWLPFGVYWLLSVALRYFPNTVEGQLKMIRIMRYTILAALVNTTLDPIIYAYSNRQIKDGARRSMRRTTINTIQPTVTE